MLELLTRRKQQKLKRQLELAIFWNNASEVKNLLRQGVDPNALLTDRERSLDLAIRHADLPIIDALLAAGADPREPFQWAGNQYRLSEVARMCKRPDEIVQRLERAEQESVAQYGFLPPLRRRSNACQLPKFAP